MMTKRDTLLYWHRMIPYLSADKWVTAYVTAFHSQQESEAFG